MPRVDPSRQIAVTPLGSLDDDPGFKPAHNIFVASKATWHKITDGLPEFAEMPPAEQCSHSEVVRGRVETVSTSLFTFLLPAS
jgi:hypothetical protein